MQIAGAITALVTPFKNGKVDEKAYRNFIEWQIQEGINGLVPCGTTGESATLSHDEHEAVVKICIEQAAGRVPVIAGAGSNNTEEAIRLLKFAKKAGADAGLMITPYYNKPTQEGLYQHFKAIASAVDLPMILYNVPGRTGSNMQASTMGRLFKDIPTVIGCKEASGNLAQVSDYLEECGPEMILLSGDDFTILPALSLGGVGVISVTSNVMPRQVSQMCSEFQKGNLDAARKIHYKLGALTRACFMETNPIPAKTALALMGKMDFELRLPLVELMPNNFKALQEMLKSYELI